jgi:predicted SAM-dependent methyltransferase
MAEALRLHLGSGDAPLPGFTNVDALPDAPGVDVVANLREPLPFADASAELIYASHVLEHLPYPEVPTILADWRRVLRDGGRLLLAVPDLDVVAEQMVRRRGWFTPPHAPWVALIYGGNKDEYDVHRGGFTDVYLAGLLAEAGFGAIRRTDGFPEVGLRDATQSYEPFGVNVSLNVRAIAGAEPFDLRLAQPWPPERVFDRIDRVIHAAMRASTRGRALTMAVRQRLIRRSLQRDS